jgi:uncharacterized protein YwgA
MIEPTKDNLQTADNVARTNAKLTRARAMLLLLFDAYCAQDYSLSRLEAQKLAYFLQAAGEPLKLNYEKQQYGPYAHNLNHVLQVMEGSFIRGYGDGTQKSEIRTLPGAVQAARELLAGDLEAQRRLQRIENLIAGFETPYGLELLATVLWLAQEDPQIGQDAEAAISAMQQWSERKKERYQPHHVRLAWQRLRAEQWAPQ